MRDHRPVDDLTVEIREVPESVTPPEPVTLEGLPNGTPLEIPETLQFSQRGRAIVIAMAGMPECGKSSLLARLHQLFQAGPVAGFDFAGSSSLPYFEELNWKATMESGEAQPVLDRTSTKYKNSFLHLKIRPTAGGAPLDVLFNDIPGETFKDAVSVQPLCDELISLARADHLVAVVDGAALATPDNRFHHINQLRDFLHRALQGNHCNSRTTLHLVVSKMDMLSDEASQTGNLESEIVGNFGPKFGSVKVWKIAARPMNGSLPTSEVISDFFKHCVTTSLRYPDLPVESPSMGWARAYCSHGCDRKKQ